MIYCNSHHPVEVKKISLKIWCLRHHIEAIIADYYKQGGTGEKKQILEIVDRYFKDSQVVEHYPHLLEKKDEGQDEGEESEEGRSK